MPPTQKQASCGDSNHLLWGGTICPDWKAALADSITEPDELCRLLGLPATMAESAHRATGDFPLLVPRSFLARIHPGDPLDPLLLQVLPTEGELTTSPEFSSDPLQECYARGGSRLLSKYSGRSLIVTNGACAVHCRFCFRRHFSQPAACPTNDPWKEALARIAAERSLREVILSGGDPLGIEDDRLAGLSRRLSQISHLRRLRIHTRMPILVPQRVNHELLAWLTGGRLPVFLVVHVNHPAEIDSAVAVALGRLIDGGVPVLSQSVLLRGVNDNADVLARLFERLADLRVMPYYLHQLDRVAGAADFEVPQATGIRLMEEVRARLSGYAVPRYVQEVPGESHKRVLG